MRFEPTSAPSPAPAGVSPVAAGVPSPARPRRRYRPRHDAAVVLAEIRRLQGAARARATRISPSV